MPLLAQRGKNVPYVRVLADRTGADLEAISAGSAPRRRQVRGSETFPLRKVHPPAVGRPDLHGREPGAAQGRGQLNLYARRDGAFDEAAVQLTETFAGSAAIALANASLYGVTARLTQQVQAAMASRAVIEQAKGIIMSRRRCSADEAFALLTRISQDSNRKVRDVAATMVTQAASGGDR